MLVVPLFTARADAAVKYERVGQFAEPGGMSGGELTTEEGTRGIAVHNASGYVLVADGPEVKAYKSFGGADHFHLAPTIVVGDAHAIAVDQADGAIYIADAAAQKIRRFTSDWAVPPTWTEDLAYVGPSAGTGDPEKIGDFTSPMTIDPTNGDLIVADNEDKRVARFTSSGTFKSGFDGAGSEAGVFSSFLSLTADDTGDVYVVDLLSGFAPFAPYEAVAERFGPDGTSKGRVATPDKMVRSVTYDPTTKNLVVASNYLFGAAPVVSTFNGGQLLDTVSYPAGTETSNPSGLAIDGGATGRLLALTRTSFGVGLKGVQVFEPRPTPDVTLHPATDVTTTAATFHATIDPLGFPNTRYWFELSADGTTWTKTPETPITVAGDVEYRETRLDPNLEYRYRLVAVNDNGETRTTSRTLTTVTSAPGTVTKRAADRTTSTATLRGTVNPYGLLTTYYFEYGPSVAYGSRIPVDYDETAGKGRVARAVTRGISGLAAGATYHFRLVARNEVGVAYGADQTFTTRAAMRERGYERVSPVEKGGSNVIPYTWFRTAADGERIAFRWRTAPGGSADAPLFPQSLGLRSASGWSSLDVDPPQMAPDGQPRPNVFSTTVRISEDLSKAIVASQLKLASGATAGHSNLYMKDLATGDLTTIVSSPERGLMEQAVSFTTAIGVIVGGTADFGHVLLGPLPFSLLPNTPAGALYEWTPGTGLQVASVSPGGTPLGGVAGKAHEVSQMRGARFISADGSRVVFNLGDDLNAALTGPAYVRIGGNQTVTMSESHRTGETGVVRDGEVIGLTADGRSAFLLSQNLTDDSVVDTQSLYRFDIDSRKLTLLTTVGIPGQGAVVRRQNWLSTSPDGSSVYFVSPAVLDAGAVNGRKNVYVWRNGAVRHIATPDPVLELGDQVRGVRAWDASPNGRYLSFVVNTNLTEYDATASGCEDRAVGSLFTTCQQVYRYDADEDSLVCVSCRPDGRSPTGNAQIGWRYPADEGDAHFPEAMLDDGTVVFDTTEPLSSDDRNSSRDVYEYDDEPTLISAGTGNGDSEIADVTPDGGTVFFTTADRLVATDTDTLTDVYGARIGGGFPEQNRLPDRGACVGDDCRGAGPGPVSSGLAPSQNPPTVRGKPQAPGKATLKVTRSAFTGTTLKLTVLVSGSGRIRVTGGKVATATRTATRSGTYSLNVRLKSKYRTQRRAGKRVKASITVKFTPAFGKSVTSKMTRTAARQR